VAKKKMKKRAAPALRLKPVAEHRIDLRHAMPIPELFAAELAPKIAGGERIEFIQCDQQYTYPVMHLRDIVEDEDIYPGAQPEPFEAWEWLVRLDGAMRKAGVPGWAQSVIGDLYMGSCNFGDGWAEDWVDLYQPGSMLVHHELIIDVDPAHGRGRAFGGLPRRHEA
jgi:hypothetical protein